MMLRVALATNAGRLRSQGQGLPPVSIMGMAMAAAAVVVVVLAEAHQELVAVAAVVMAASTEGMLAVAAAAATAGGATQDLGAGAVQVLVAAVVLPTAGRQVLAVEWQAAAAGPEVAVAPAVVMARQALAQSRWQQRRRRLRTAVGMCMIGSGASTSLNYCEFLPRMVQHSGEPFSR